MDERPLFWTFGFSLVRTSGGWWTGSDHSKKVSALLSPSMFEAGGETSSALKCRPATRAGISTAPDSDDRLQELAGPKANGGRKAETIKEEE